MAKEAYKRNYLIWDLVFQRVGIWCVLVRAGWQDQLLEQYLSVHALTASTQQRG